MKLKYEFVITEINEQTVAIPAGDTAEKFDGFINLNETAKEIWEQLTRDTTCEEIVKTLAKKYTESSTEEISAYVNDFIEKLREGGLLSE